MRRISDVARERELAVHTLSSYPDINNSLKMEVGIEDSLHIEFEYNKSKYALPDLPMYCVCICMYVHQQLCCLTVIHYIAAAIHCMHEATSEIQQALITS